jgi:flavin reductase (DIM6/NTAB) family NADH-FMN oxidoreductase RutF
MEFDLTGLPGRDVYRLMIGLITPRPIAWVSTLSENGVPNLAPFSYFMGVASRPATVAFSCANRRDGSQKDTIRNLEHLPELVISVVSHDLREPMSVTSEDLPHEVDELLRAGLTTAASRTVRPPRVAEARAHLECVVDRILHVGEGPAHANLVIARVLHAHVSDEILDPTGQVDPRKLDALGRMGGDLYCRTTDVFPLGKARGG